jgi:hypothetical protein
MGTLIHTVRAGLVGLVLFACPAALGADPIVITGGLVETNVGISAARVTLEGEGFALRTAASFGSPLAPLCSPCAAGTPVTLNGTYTQGLPFGGTLTIDGATYTDLHFLGGFGTFITPEVALPATGSLALPFEFSGLLLAFSNPNDAEPVFSTKLIGSGTAMASFIRVTGEDNLFNLLSEGLQYRFEAAAAPVPEPTSMLLLGTGLAGVAVGRWRRRNRTCADRTSGAGGPHGGGAPTGGPQAAGTRPEAHGAAPARAEPATNVRVSPYRSASARRMRQDPDPAPRGSWLASTSRCERSCGSYACRPVGSMPDLGASTRARSMISPPVPAPRRFD